MCKNDFQFEVRIWESFKNRDENRNFLLQSNIFTLMIYDTIVYYCVYLNGDNSECKTNMH
jgi:hypothetical protein